MNPIAFSIQTKPILSFRASALARVERIYKGIALCYTDKNEQYEWKGVNL